MILPPYACEKFWEQQSTLTVKDTLLLSVPKVPLEMGGGERSFSHAPSAALESATGESEFRGRLFSLNLFKGRLKVLGEAASNCRRRFNDLLL